MTYLTTIYCKQLYKLSEPTQSRKSFCSMGEVSFSSFLRIVIIPMEPVWMDTINWI